MEVWEQTENLFDGYGDGNYGYYNGNTGVYVNDRRYKHWRISVSQGDIIRATGGVQGLGCVFYEGNYVESIRGIPYSGYIVPSGIDEITNNTSIVYANTFIITKNQPLPAQYIPYGYKLPMAVYKQELTVTNDMLDQSNWTLSGYWFMYFNISDLISKEECDVKIYENFADGYIPQLLTVAITDKRYSMVDDSYRILKNYGEILNKKFDFSLWDNIYLCIGYGNGYSSEIIKQLKIDELFGNWKILIAPVSQTREAPVYIGENQLDSVEGVSDYVDKSSGKIVRMIGEYTFTGDETYYEYGGRGACCMAFNISPRAKSSTRQITMRCDHTAFTAISNTALGYWANAGLADNACNFRIDTSQVVFRSTANFMTERECKAYLKTQYDNGTPVKISYWLKTPVEEDPPVPFPEIPTIKGETVIDYDGTPKPSQMYIKYRR